MDTPTGRDAAVDRTGPTTDLAAGLTTLDDLRAARARLDASGVVVRTPLLTSPLAPGLWLKPESLQPIGAFKIRGAYARMSQLSPEELGRGVVTHSSGNHAQAVAYAAARLGTRAVVVMPEHAAAVKVDATRALGAEVVLAPAAERESRVAELVERHGYLPVPPFDDAGVIAGQGSVGLEIVEDAERLQLPLRTVVVPVGGGGLISGVAAAVKLQRPDVRVVGAEPELAADAAESLREGRRVRWSPDDTARTLADGLRTAAVGELPWRHLQAYVDEVLTVGEDQIRALVRDLARTARLVVEPSGAVAPAAAVALAAAGGPSDGATVAVVTGGNIDPVLFAQLLTR